MTELTQRRMRIGLIYGLRRHQFRRLTYQELGWIRHCKTEAARRLMLGVSRKIARGRGSSVG